MPFSTRLLILLLSFHVEPGLSFQAIQGANTRHACSVRLPRLVLLQEITQPNHPEPKTTSRSAWNAFLQNLWKGVTLPFPALRKLVQTPDGNSLPISFGMSLREGFLYVLAYLATGVFAYTVVLEKWSVVDALYFSCVTFSTVGYGDLCPSTPQSKLFTCVFGLCGIAFLGAAIATIGGRVIQAEVEAVQEARQRSKKRLAKIFEGMPAVLKRHRHKNHIEQRQAVQKAQTRMRRTLEEYKAGRWVTTIAQLVRRVLPSLFIIFGGSALVHHLNGHSRWFSLDSIYLGLITASTIGFGDFSPQTKWARLLAVVYIPLSVAAAGDLFSGLANALLVRRQREVFVHQLEKDLTIKHLQAMDVDGDGKITREEYVQFMLIEMGLVSAEEFKELAEQFERLDVTKSGYLDNDDLKLMAELRGATVKGSPEKDRNNLGT
ncbi:potassium channel subfamily K, other eukaryote [Fistulifera solaris]|uniref:Potassium channel subfamily K, other eukaryote n=1 Tax=Fistulifera solaris TaxID=1519565 RepID=A0A1Z5JZP1_FISSO|nr:potassium channel subfamily K, other eukaryote [Fistulifera solaris]|eukprot:GAX19369.1 potassium channel subfamily K, other eukaryote [Fistulifera solaris]